jgi:hypothetical protein
MKIILYKKKNSGFSLVENLIATAIFILLATIIYQSSALFIRAINSYRENITISNLADRYMEIIHNLPYSSVGTINGNPHGNLVDLPNADQEIINGSTYKTYYVVNYIDDPSDGTILNGTDFSPNDYKQVKLYITNINTEKSYYFVTNITPKGLENLNNAGALYIKVFNSIGQPVPLANVTIKNTNITPNINLNRKTDASGNLLEVGLPISANSYEIAVSKNGYSSDETYPSTAENPNPTKPDATIANGQVTQISFSIDELSNLTFQTLDQTCSPLSNIDIDVKGAKLIGSNPKVLKFNREYKSTDTGDITLGNIEWDNYTPVLTDETKILYGSSPIQVITILPKTDQNFTLILGPKTVNSLLVIVKDAVTNSPIEGASVVLKNERLNYESQKYTGGSVWSSDDWSGGPDQVIFSDVTKYFSGFNISTGITPTALRLISYDNGQTYVTSGSLISSTFDTGTASTSFTTLDWKPTSQNASTSIRFQIATSDSNATSTTWNFIGPDGTSGSYYDTPQTTINNASARYIRYKTFLSTIDDTVTPVLTSVNINYVSGCHTPGQVFFPSLTVGDDYETTISLSGYLSQTIDPSVVSGNKQLEILLSN